MTISFKEKACQQKSQNSVASKHDVKFPLLCDGIYAFLLQTFILNKDNNDIIEI